MLNYQLSVVGSRESAMLSRETSNVKRERVLENRVHKHWRVLHLKRS